MLLGVVTVMSVAFLVTALVFLGQFQGQLNQQYQHLGQMLASVVSVEGADRLGVAQPSQATQQSLQRLTDAILANSPDVLAIEYYGNDNTLLFENHRTGTGKPIPRPLTVSAPVRSSLSNQPLGQVHVKLTGQTQAVLANHVQTILWGGYLGAWLLAVLALTVHNSVWGRHLRTLTRGVVRISNGDFGYRIPDKDLSGELRPLAKSFNELSLRLKAYEDQNVDTITFERNKLEAILLSIADGVIVCDEQGKVIIANDPAARMLSLNSPNSLVGQSIRAYRDMDEARPFQQLLDKFNAYRKETTSPAAIKADLKGSLAASQAALSQAIPLRSGREPFVQTLELAKLTLKVLVSPVQNEAFSKLGFVMIMHDITREAEVDKLKTQFISNVSHELRTPVTTIKSYVDTLFNHGDELDEATYTEFVETLYHETDRLKKLVNDILDFSRLEQGGVTLDKEWQEMAPLLNLTLQSMKVLAQQKNLTLTSAIESQLPKVYINADSIERVLRNLISNAIKYTPEGGRIKCRVELSQQGDWVEVSVEDNGIGIPPEHLPNIFDRFYRVENKVHTVKGTGLGLHLVKVAIEDHHHGQVFVESEPRVGSRFGFKLPIFVDEEETT
jgi:two-component system sensor histidine kinase NblS